MLPSSKQVGSLANTCFIVWCSTGNTSNLSLEYVIPPTITIAVYVLIPVSLCVGSNVIEDVIFPL